MSETMEGPVVQFTKGPGMISWGFMMILWLALIMGVLKGIWPTAPPTATIAGPEVEARALLGQSRAAFIMAGVCALVLALWTRVRIATFDFTAKTLRIEDLRAIFFAHSRTYAFADIKEMSRHGRFLPPTYQGWMLRIHLHRGGSVLLGPWAPDPGLHRLIDRVMDTAQTPDAQGGRAFTTAANWDYGSTRQMGGGMRTAATEAHITDFIWDATGGAKMRRRIGTYLSLAGLGALGVGLIPGFSLPRISGFDTVWIACAAVVGGVWLLAFAMARSRTRRIRVDRKAQQIEVGLQDPGGAWFTAHTIPFASVTELRVKEIEQEDAPSVYTLEIWQNNADYPVDLQEMVGQRECGAVEAVRDAIKAAMTGA